MSLRALEINKGCEAHKRNVPRYVLKRVIHILSIVVLPFLLWKNQHGLVLISLIFSMVFVGWYLAEILGAILLGKDEEDCHYEGVTEKQCPLNGQSNCPKRDMFKVHRRRANL